MYASAPQWSPLVRRSITKTPFFIYIIFPYYYMLLYTYNHTYTPQGSLSTQVLKIMWNNTFDETIPVDLPDPNNIFERNIVKKWHCHRSCTRHNQRSSSNKTTFKDKTSQFLTFHSKFFFHHEKKFKFIFRYSNSVKEKN